MENLPYAFRDVYNGKYMGKPIVEFEHNWKWEIDHELYFIFSNFEFLGI